MSASRPRPARTTWCSPRRRTRSPTRCAAPATSSRRRCGPPADRDALWAGLADGLARSRRDRPRPRTASASRRPKPATGVSFDRSATALPASRRCCASSTARASREAGSPLERMVDLLRRPRRRGSGSPRKGALEVGRDADVVVFDPAARRTLRPPTSTTPATTRRTRWLEVGGAWSATSFVRRQARSSVREAALRRAATSARVLTRRAPVLGDAPPHPAPPSSPVMHSPRRGRWRFPASAGRRAPPARDAAPPPPGGCRLASTFIGRGEERKHAERRSDVLSLTPSIVTSRPSRRLLRRQVLEAELTSGKRVPPHFAAWVRLTAGLGGEGRAANATRARLAPAHGRTRAIPQDGALRWRTLNPITHPRTGQESVGLPEAAAPRAVPNRSACVMSDTHQLSRGGAPCTRPARTGWTCFTRGAHRSSASGGERISTLRLPSATRMSSIPRSRLRSRGSACLEGRRGGVGVNWRRRSPATSTAVGDPVGLRAGRERGGGTLAGGKPARLYSRTA